MVDRTAMEGRIVTGWISLGLTMDTIDPVSIRNFCWLELIEAAISMKKSPPVQAATTLGVSSLTLGCLGLLVVMKQQSTEVSDQATYTRVYTAWHYLHRRRIIGKFLVFAPR